MTEHPVDAALRLLHASASPAARLEVVWRAFEVAHERTLHRPPLVEERDAVLTWLQEERGRTDGPLLITRRTHLRSDLAYTVVERASALAQMSCRACEPVQAEDGTYPLNILSLPIDVEPWTAQSRPARTAIREAVTSELRKRRESIEPWAGSPLCVTVVSLLPRAKKAIYTKDADNLVKGLLDACNGVLWKDDRAIQCLTARRVEYSGERGCYFLNVRAVWPRTDAVVQDSARPPRILSGSRVEI